MESEFRLCPVCRAPNTVQDAVCAACGATLPAVARAPPPAFERIPDRQEARQAARTGVRRGLAVGVACAVLLGLLVARTFRTPGLHDSSTETASAEQPAPTPSPEPAVTTLAPAPLHPSQPYGFERPNPYASGNVAVVASPWPAGASPTPAAVPASAPALIIAAAPAGTRPPLPVDAAQGGDGSKPASYTDADLERVRHEPAPPPPRSPEEEAAREARFRERGEAVRAAEQRVREAQTVVDDLRAEARVDDDAGLQEELDDALAVLKSAQRDLARARRRVRELEDQARPQ